jgi:hypothetical protein
MEKKNGRTELRVRFNVKKSSWKGRRMTGRTNMIEEVAVK